ncbi:Na+/H+ antiporter NhaC [Tissierella sp. P1]|uniref:Na+/H+ antiporter NhaC n=1 Tax=Tissierella sp. P1 TaxID=1280483 RepID=UPI000B9FAE8D|nr:Na+/H+ antiporter NhaC [Tissierella sp. P1]OZV10445.1 Na+/H+ antiporter NhaC [Tissierella sp. P1]
MDKTLSEVKKPSLLLSLVPFLALIGFMLPGVIILEVEPHIPLIAASILTAFIGKYLGHSWDDMEKAMIESNAMVMQANFIILIVGMLVGTWIAGGIVPGLIYYGLELFTPNMFLFLLPVICSVISVSTGSAWTTAGTIGTAAMGIGAALGIPPAITAGAVVTGASFGDKLSPLSDSTNLAAAVTGTNVFDHVRHMLYSTIPSFLIAISIFGFIGTSYKNTAVNIEQIFSVLESIDSIFIITPWIFIAPLTVILMIIFKAPAVPGMIGGTFVGILFSLFQGHGLKNTLYYIMYGFEVTTGNVLVDKLLNRGGMSSMLEIIALVICALTFGGLIKQIGVIDTILETILRKVRKRGSIILSTVISSIAMNFMAADQYMAIVIPGQMFRPVFERLNLHSKNLSRILEDAGTLTSGLVPWSTCGAVYFATLGVSSFQYGRFHFLGLINPIIAVVFGYTGFALARLDPSKPIKNFIDD